MCRQILSLRDTNALPTRPHDSLHETFLFFFNHTSPPEIYTLSLHDALPIFAGLRVDVAVAVIAAQRFAAADPALWRRRHRRRGSLREPVVHVDVELELVHHHDFVVNGVEDRKSTRLNSSHQIISYAVFCLKK